MVKKIAYLTIDDCPSEDMKRKVDFLFEKEIPAIWFCRGEFLEKRQEVTSYAIKRGFIMGNHSYNHPLFSRITFKECFRQIKVTDELVENAYLRAGVKRPAKLFRFPWGDKGGGFELKKGGFLPRQKNPDKIKSIQDFLRKQGYEQPSFENIRYDWFNKANLLKDADVWFTYDSMDWAILMEKPMYGIYGLREILKRMDEDAPEEGMGLNYADSNEIILLHDLTELTFMFRPIIEKLLEKGLRFQTPKFHGTG
ncbi:MAG: polysaccharide deacetylase family protein [Candidatus Bathyarchaeota archaeon]|nr:MAG: polysaccharide deacetylase family protein [Candidatus Bathyarchaeota archaeon]